MKRCFVVTLNMPEEVTVREMIEYIDEAVSTYKGCYYPGEPLFSLDRDSVKVKSVPIKRKVVRKNVV